MKVLLTGASGFIGSHLLSALLRAGHQVIGIVRHPPAAPQYADISYMSLDFSHALQADDWLDAVAGVDAIINAVGIFRESRSQSFDILHRAAPCALFSAGARAGVQKIIQISALGADATAQTAFLLSKKAADDFLLSLPVNATVVQPSLVYGPGGTSAQQFNKAASLPIIPLPGNGEQQIQPVHIDDLTQLVLALLEQTGDIPSRIPAAGPVGISLRSFYAMLRQAMGITSPARFIAVPWPLVEAAATVGNRLPTSLLTTDSIKMLRRGNTANIGEMKRILGHAPRAVGEFVPRPYAGAVKMRAQMLWLLPVLRISIALVWIVTGFVSLGLYPVEDSYALLARTGTPPWLMPVFLYGAALLDLTLGILTLLPNRSRHLWLAQAGLILAYTVIISLKLPEFWLHPYGPVLKNLPLLAALWILHELEDGKWNT
ncbi:MAG TPA: NAD(P)H-binding protein [Candidimonas sp.]|nr:NAD(P)H-binding protein [Candidimonas sp.]